MTYEEEFELKSYSKTELSKMYNPMLCNRSALRILMLWIDHNKELKKSLVSAGFTPTLRVFTPKQVELIISFLGEP